MLRRIILFVLICGFCRCTLRAQRVSGQVGVGYTFARPDFLGPTIQGVSFYGGYNVGAHFGLAGEINLPRFNTPRDIGESSYLYGARYQLNKSVFHPYAKVLFGLGSFQYQKGYYAHPTTLHYPAYVFGGGLDVFLKHKINIRVIDLEYQYWPSFSPNGLTPFEGTVGIGRRF